MRPDHLSELFDLIDVRGTVTGGFVADGSWTAHTPILTPLKMIAVARGRARVETDGETDPVDLVAGDVAVLTGRTWVTVTGGPEGTPVRLEPEPGLSFTRRPRAPTSDVVVGGHAGLNAAGHEILLQALPPLGVVRGDAHAAHVPYLLERLLTESADVLPGSDYAARHYAHLVILEVVRACATQAALRPGFLRVLADEQVGPSARAMLTSPGTPWRLEDLANTVSMSRTSFAQRFREAAGVPPLAYLTRWRMLRAQRALIEGDITIGTLAHQLGYGSEAAFSTAFKRETGTSPREHRQRAHAP